MIARRRAAALTSGEQRGSGAMNYNSPRSQRSSTTTDPAEMLQRVVQALSLANGSVAQEIERIRRRPTQACNSAAYWAQRHKYQLLGYEWCLGYSTLRHVLTRVLPKHGTILQIGVGTSLLQEHMLEDGYHSITSIDISAAAIQRLLGANHAEPRLSYEVADACHMQRFPGSSFAGVLDKGTLDCLSSSGCASAQQRRRMEQQQGDHRYIERDDDEDEEGASDHQPLRMLQECCRVLEPGAPLVVVSCWPPAARMQLLLHGEGLKFKSVSFYGVATCCNTGSAVHVVGPFTDVEQGLDAALFEDVDGVMQVDYVYVAVKA